MDFFITPYVVLMMKYNLPYSVALLTCCMINFTLIVLLIMFATSLKIMLQKIMYDCFCGRKIKNVLSIYLKIFIDFCNFFKKQEIYPFKSEKLLFVSAPIIVLTPAIFIWSFIPFSANFQAIKTDMSAIYFLAFSLIYFLGTLLCVYASKNTFSVWGAYRAVVQVVSFFIPLLLAVMSICLLADSMDLRIITEKQYNSGCFSWFCFPAFIGFVTFFSSMLAIVNARPFDLASSESEIAAGFKTEYSGISFIMLSLADDILMVGLTIFCAVIFLGGFLPPWHFMAADVFAQSKFWYNFILTIEQFFWIFAKTFMLLFIINLIKFFFPRFRPDQAALFGWKYMLPLSFINLLLVCLIKQGGACV